MRVLKFFFVAMITSFLAMGLVACENGDDDFGGPEQQEFSVQADQQAPDTQAAEGDWDFPEEDEDDDDEDDAPEW